MRMYQVGYRKSTKWTDPLELGSALEIVKDRIVGKGPFRLRVRGDDRWSKQRGLTLTMFRLERLAKSLDIGHAIWVDTDGPRIVVLRIVEFSPVEVPRLPDGASMNLLPVWETVWTGWPHIVSWGICNCRRIAGSTSWSYHAYCQAWDIHSSTETMDAIASYLRAHQADLDLIQVLWRVPDHYDHIHLAVEPVRDLHLTPPCAR